MRPGYLGCFSDSADTKHQLYNKTSKRLKNDTVYSIIFCLFGASYERSHQTCHVSGRCHSSATLHPWFSLPKTVPDETMRSLFEQAQQAPSNCNTQPWYVVVASGDLRNSLRDQFVDRAMGEHPLNLILTTSANLKVLIVAGKLNVLARCTEKWRSHATTKPDAAGRPFVTSNFLMRRMWPFLCMDRSFGATIAVDVGIYAQTLMLGNDSPWDWFLCHGQFAISS
ncbi:MAG: nitroreductase family protein [Marinobacter sp.]|nr:nitroreductase family protein [Marinobacter sp.]